MRDIKVLNKAPVITIDGLSGSGKGTVAKLAAKSLNWHYLESGLLYRILAFASIHLNIALDNVETLIDLAQNLPAKFKGDIDETKVYWSDYEVTDEIYTEQYGNIASKIAIIPQVREALLLRQRLFCTEPGLVTDGRDMGTVVFPDAKLKFFLVAERKERAKRRYHQLKNKGINVSLENIFDELTERDYRDQHRSISPLRPALDAIMVDTTSLNCEETFLQVMEWIQKVFRSSID
jgi:CMP/dCMP kinase